MKRNHNSVTGVYIFGQYGIETNEKAPAVQSVIFLKGLHTSLSMWHTVVENNREELLRVLKIFRFVFDFYKYKENCSAPERKWIEIAMF
jgi:hypothetical protein